LAVEHLCPLFPLAFPSILAGVPQVHHFGQEGLHNVLVIDLLGPNLEDLFDMCGRKFTIKTVCMAARQMVSVQCFIFNYRVYYESVI
jgi:casein kinase 1